MSKLLPNEFDALRLLLTHPVVSRMYQDAVNASLEAVEAATFAALHGSEAGPRDRQLLKTLLLDCIQITDDRALVCRHCEGGIEASANKPIPHEDGCVVGQIQEMIKTEAGPQEAREEQKTPWTIDGSMPLPACRNDIIRRADVVTMWNNWRQGLPLDRPFRHGDGVDFLNRLNDIAGSDAGVSARVRIDVEAEEGCFAVDAWQGDTAFRMNVFDTFDEANGYRQVMSDVFRAALGVSPAAPEKE
jgi:hypothetical protein